MRYSVIVHIPKDSLTKCKEAVQQFRKISSDFKEIGGYLIGNYNGDFEIMEFLLDANAESTTTRIKLSAECFERVEESLSKTPELLYIGTWHVHPGKSKPVFSPTDRSTLFLEKLVIETDNPKEYKCPRIHLIFSEDLQQISAYTMQVNLDYEITDYWEAEKQVNDNDIDRIDAFIKKLTDIKKDLHQYKKNKRQR